MLRKCLERERKLPQQQHKWGANCEILECDCTVKGFLDCELTEWVGGTGGALLPGLWTVQIPFHTSCRPPLIAWSHPFAPWVYIGRQRIKRRGRGGIGGERRKERGRGDTGWRGRRKARRGEFLTAVRMPVSELHSHSLPSSLSACLLLQSTLHTPHLWSSRVR